jgi:tetratricopeptide (TPR) repeat protein
MFSWGLFAQSPVEKAIGLVKQRNYAEAKRSIAGVPEPSDTRQRIAFHRLKAAIESGLGQPALAVREMRTSLAFAPNDSNLLVATAISEMQAGLLDDALQHANAAESTAQARAVIGDIEEKRGNYAAAASAYQSAVSIAPDQESYRVALAMDLIEHQSLPVAIKFLNQSAPHFPQSAKLRTLLGIAQYASGFSDDAITAFEDAITTDPHFSPAYGCLEQVLLESSAAPKQEAVDLLCRWNAIACSAVKLRVAREQDDAATIAAAIKVLERAPAQDAIAHCELARAYEWSQQLKAARGQMEVCVNLEPTPQNHYRLGIIYKRLGLPDLARNEMELRNQLQARMSEETAAGMNVLQTFKLATQ